MKKIISAILIILLLLLLFAAVLLISFFTGYEVYTDVSYGSLDLEVMDIYVPDEAYKSESVGCVLFIHGGSWSGGDKRDEELRCRLLASRGYIAATVNYTLYAEGKEDYSIDTVLDEIDAALEMLKSFANERGITIDRAATSGYSAGAHISMLYSFSRAGAAPLDIKFTANMAGPADIRSEIWGDELALRIGEILSGVEITSEMIDSGEAEEILDSISPVTYVSADTPPSLFAYGGKDNIVPAENGESLKAAFDAAGVDYDYVFFPNSDHGLISDLGRRIEYYSLLIDFCDEYFE